MTSPTPTTASLATCLLLNVWSPTARDQNGRPPERPTSSRTAAAATSLQGEQGLGCGVQYVSGKELTRVRDQRIQALFQQLLARFGITEQVLLCADIPRAEKNFAETIRRSDGRGVVTISSLLLDFRDDEVTGILAHELAHLLAGDPEHPRPTTLDEYLREERAADIKAAEFVGRGAVCAAVKRAYEMSVALGYESKTNILRQYRDRRLKWISERRAFDGAPQCAFPENG